MILFDTPIPLAWIGAGALLGGALLVWTLFRLRGLIHPKYLWSLAGLRTWAFLAILLLLINPYRLERQPDSKGFRVAVLVDASGSMDTPDIDGGRGTRFDLIRNWLARENSPLNALDANGRQVDVSLFSDETVPVSGDPHLLPGGTNLGEALQRELNDVGRRAEIGAVLLVSDGQSNGGISPIEAAQHFRTRGIPVSTLGVGSRTPPGEVRAEFSSPQYHGQRGDPLPLAVNVSNTRSQSQEIRLELHSDEGFLEAKTVTVPADSDEVVTFQVTPFQAGGDAYRLVAQAPNAPEQVDVAAVQVSEPDQFRILFLGAHPSLEYRFLQQAVADTDQIELEAIIRTGPESVFQILTGEQESMAPVNAFPDEPSFFNAFDAILMDAPVLAEMSPEALTALRGFVANRGGGILLAGAPTEAPEALADVLPVAAAEQGLPFARHELTISPAPIFNDLTGGALFSRPALFLPEELPAHLATEWKRGARPILRPANGQGSLMTVQAYGAGRVAWLGTNATWRWRMASATGVEQHRLFWNNTLVWLASTGKPRLSVPLQGTRVPLAADMNLGIDVMGSDFRPAQEASVEALVTSPDGEVRRVQLQRSFQQPGRFEADFHPAEAGEYRIQYEVAFPGDERLTREAFFIASHHDREREETRYREDVLRDIARLTGGDFYHHTEVDGNLDLPLAEGIPTTETRRHLAGNPLFLLLLALPLFGEWYIRRRLGLK